MRPIADHFSGHAKSYASARPTYPTALFDWIAEQSPRHDRVLDVGCGSGQAATALARYFAQVVATDISLPQLQAMGAEGVNRVTARAERPPLRSHSCDCICVAQALHWFDGPAFARSVRRVATKDALLVAWCYGLATVTARIDAVVRYLYHDLVGPDWPPERTLIETGYRTIELPGRPLMAPSLTMSLAWSFEALVAYLTSWSAVQRYRQRTGDDPIAAIAPDLRAAWGGDQKRRIHWPLTVRASVL